MRGFDNRCTPSRGTSSSLHKTRAARLPDARHPRPRPPTRRAANSPIGFIDVLEIHGGRRRSEAGLLQQLRSLQPSARGCLSSPSSCGLAGMGILLHGRGPVAPSRVRGVCHSPAGDRWRPEQHRGCRNGSACPGCPRSCRHCCETSALLLDVLCTSIHCCKPACPTLQPRLSQGMHRDGDPRQAEGQERLQPGSAPAPPHRNSPRQTAGHSSPSACSLLGIPRCNSIKPEKILVSLTRKSLSK